MRSLTYTIVLFVLSISSVYTQESIGLKFDPYSALESTSLNPALSQDAECNFEISLGGIQGFLYSNYGAIRSTNLLGLRSLDTLIVHYDRETVPQNPNKPTLIFDQGHGKKNISFGYEISGPSFLYKITPDIKVGAFTKMRGALTSFDIPVNYGGFELMESEETEIIESEASSLTGLMWKEAGIHISQRINNFILGVNAKYIIPTFAGIARINSAETLSYVNGIVEVPKDADLAYTTSAEDFTNAKDALLAPNNGNGYGVDVGISYINSVFSLSASIIDIGMVRNIVNTKHFRIEDGRDDLTINTKEYSNLEDLNSYFDKVDQDLPLISNSNEGMMVYLPTAISVQGHLRVIPKFNITGIWVHRIPKMMGNVEKNVNTLNRDNTISIMPRYTAKWVSVAIPVSMHEYDTVHVGASLRMGYFTIGSDNVASLIGNTDFHGTDFYAKFSFFPYWNQKIKKKKKKKRKVRKESSSKKNVKCYSF